MRKSLIYTVIRSVGRIFFSMESLRKEARPFLAKVVYKRVGKLGVGRFTRLYSQKKHNILLVVLVYFYNYDIDYASLCPL